MTELIYINFKIFEIILILLCVNGLSRFFLKNPVFPCKRKKKTSFLKKMRKGLQLKYNGNFNFECQKKV